MSFPSIFSKQNPTNEIERFFEENLWDIYNPFKKNWLANNVNQFYPHVDFSETDNDYSLEFDLPGLKKEDIDIKLDGQLLTIRGTREEKHKTQGRNFYTKERSYGEFMRSITLPSNVKSDSIDASFQDGVLHITLQKHQGDSVKKINIK